MDRQSLREDGHTGLMEAPPTVILPAALTVVMLVMAVMTVAMFTTMAAKAPTPLQLMH